jgi:hypothetical protein
VQPTTFGKTAMAFIVCLDLVQMATLALFDADIMITTNTMIILRCKGRPHLVFGNGSYAVMTAFSIFMDSLFHPFFRIS